MSEIDEIGQTLGRTAAAVLSAALLTARIAMQRRAEQAEQAGRAGEERQRDVARRLHADRETAAIQWDRVNIRAWFRERPGEVADVWASAAVWAAQDPRAREAFDSLNSQLGDLGVSPEVAQAMREASDYEGLAELLKRGAQEARGEYTRQQQAAKGQNVAGEDPGTAQGTAPARGGEAGQEAVSSDLAARLADYYHQHPEEAVRAVNTMIGRLGAESPEMIEVLRAASGDAPSLAAWYIDNPARGFDAISTNAARHGIQMPDVGQAVRQLTRNAQRLDLTPGARSVAASTPLDFTITLTPRGGQASVEAGRGTAAEAQVTLRALAERVAQGQVCDPATLLDYRVTATPTNDKQPFALAGSALARDVPASLRSIAARIGRDYGELGQDVDPPRQASPTPQTAHNDRTDVAAESASGAPALDPTPSVSTARLAYELRVSTVDGDPVTMQHGTGSPADVARELGWVATRTERGLLGNQPVTMKWHLMIGRPDEQTPLTTYGAGTASEVAGHLRWTADWAGRGAPAAATTAACGKSAGADPCGPLSLKGRPCAQGREGDFQPVHHQRRGCDRGRRCRGAGTP
jgi:hypothetical protein